jgi:hypothetical protein
MTPSTDAEFKSAMKNSAQQVAPDNQRLLPESESYRNLREVFKHVWIFGQRLWLELS